MSLVVTFANRERVSAKLKRTSPAIISALTRLITRAGYMLQHLVEADKLTGGALNVRTGRLRRSINTKIEHAGTSAVTASVGTNVEYARIHEYGGVIEHPGGTAYLFDRQTAQARFIRNDDPLSYFMPRTRPHSIPMPERSFLRSALQELRPRIVSDIESGVRKAAHDA